MITQLHERYRGPAPTNYTDGPKAYAMQARGSKELQAELGIVDGQMTKPIAADGTTTNPKEQSNDRPNPGPVRGMW